LGIVCLAFFKHNIYMQDLRPS